MGTDSEPPASVAFGRYELLPHRRELLADGQPIKLGGRTYDVLIVLIEAHGALVSKEALMARVWPGRVVEENAIQAQISALRRAFGAERDLIRTVAGRGYQFAGEIHRQSTSSREPASPAGDSRPAPVVVPSRSAVLPTNLPGSVSALIGRDAELRDIVSLVASHRLVTLTGPGGIGKTRLALAAGHALLPEFPGGVWLAEFSPLSDPSLVPARVVAAVGLELATGEISARRVAQALAGRLLLLLDTCEHVIDAAAELAEAVLRTAPGVRIIATSREALRADGEQICAVPPLAVPTEGDDPWQYGAVQLFAARSRGTGAQVIEDRQVGLAIAAICQRLDGIPLALELAAARTNALSIDELAARLDDRFQLLTGGRRTALPRHQTLRATLDWSHELLTAVERIVLRRLAVFAGAFGLEAAGAVATDAALASSDDILAGISSLLAKSLLVVTIDGTTARYRLLDTTRAYALEKLGESGERAWLERRHAEYYRGLFAQAETEWEQRPRAEWLDDYAGSIDNLRAALDWAFSPDGDAAIGVPLAARAVPLWLELSLLTECRNRTEIAIGKLNDAGLQSSQQEIVLQTAFGLAVMYTEGRTSRAQAALTRASELAESFQDHKYQLRPLSGLALFCLRLEDFQGALALARRAETIARRDMDPVAVSTVDCIIGITLCFLGEYPDALAYCRHSYRGVAFEVRHAQTVRSGMDYTILARCIEVHILWIGGHYDQAARDAPAVLDAARDMGHPASLCQALAWCGCRIPLKFGALATTEQSIVQLKELSETNGLRTYLALASGYEAQLTALRGDADRAEQHMRSCLDGLRATQYEHVYTAFLTSLGEILAMRGQFGAALAAADEALRRCESSGGVWWLPEALRIKGNVLLLSGPAHVSAAEDCWRRAMDLARRQGALSWELPAAVSLARLWRDHSRHEEARQLLAPVYQRFAAGFATADMRAAKSLLDELG
jgi:predicted ATPase/DNA-binding winged helix-turn-helix (wHTH) protein